MSVKPIPDGQHSLTVYLGVSPAIRLAISGSSALTRKTSHPTRFVSGP